VSCITHVNQDPNDDHWSGFDPSWSQARLDNGAPCVIAVTLGPSLYKRSEGLGVIQAVTHGSD
jgi:hypothetical protein